MARESKWRELFAATPVGGTFTVADERERCKVQQISGYYGLTLRTWRMTDDSGRYQVFVVSKHERPAKQSTTARYRQMRMRLADRHPDQEFLAQSGLD